MQSCRLARFYGWTLDEIEALDVEQFASVYRGMEIIECQEAMLAINVSSYSSMKKESQKSFFNKLKRQSENVEVKVMSMEQLGEFLGG